MTRKLIVECDGTWNDASQDEDSQDEDSQDEDNQPAPANVVKLMRALRKGRNPRQHYQQGVGTRQ